MDKKNCIVFRKIWDKRTEKLPNISWSLSFVNKLPSLISPPHERPKLNSPPPGGINKAFAVIHRSKIKGDLEAE